VSFNSSRPFFFSVMFFAAALFCQSDAYAGCEVSRLCNKTIMVNSRWELNDGSATGTGFMNVYIANSGTAFITYKETTSTDKMGGNSVGTICTEAGSETINKCPSASCTNPYVPTNPGDYFRSTETTICKLQYTSTGFVLKKNGSRLDRVYMEGVNLPGKESVTKTHFASEETYELMGDQCELKSTSSSHAETSNKYYEGSTRSVTCRIVEGMQL
jgi:hypothetical protein